jgi:predicted site-specific integrase-resolvase
MDEEIMTEEEAARRLRVPLARLKQWSREGKLTEKRLDDGKVVFSLREVEALRISIKKARPRCRN